MPNTSPTARSRNSSGIRRCEIGPPPLVKMRCTEEPMKKVPSVARNGLMRRPTTRAALTRPTIMPPTSPMADAAIQSKP